MDQKEENIQKDKNNINFFVYVDKVRIKKERIMNVGLVCLKADKLKEIEKIFLNFNEKNNKKLNISKDSLDSLKNEEETDLKPKIRIISLKVVK